jgi:2-polyprenyl-6-methoxyphenol hydroxylase-like FAD-dependent oxidoreductase
VTILNRVRFERLRQDEEGVTALARNVDSGEMLEIRGKYLVGCDGGRSEVRRQIGAKLEGDAVIQRVQSTYIRAPRLIELLTTAPAWGNRLRDRRPGDLAGP